MRDLAKLQILALTTPGAANKRFVVGHSMIFNDVAEVLRKDSQLGISERIGQDNSEPETLTLPRMDINDVEKVFGFKWAPLDITIVDTAAALLKIEKLSA